MNSDIDNTTIGLYIIVFAVIGVIYLLPSLITTWKLFEKAGQFGWAALIPLYSSYVFGIIAKRPLWLIAVFIVLGVISNTVQILSLPYVVLALYFLYWFIKQYSASLLFWIMYIFIPWVSVFMVDKVQFIGEVAQPTSTQPTAPVGADATSAPVQPTAVAQVQQTPVGLAPQPLEAQQFTPTQAPAQPVAIVAPGTLPQSSAEPISDQGPQVPPVTP